MAYEAVVFVGASVQLIGIISYVKETLKGKTKPNRVTWLMWTIAPMIATFAALADGVSWSVLPVFMSGFGPLLVLISSFINRNAYWKLERFDYLCGSCSLLALLLWGITREPVVAIVFSIASDGFAAIPTLKKLWAHPETEIVHPFLAGLFGALTSFAAVGAWKFSAYAFPVYLVVINVSIILLFYRRNFVT